MDDYMKVIKIRNILQKCSDRGIRRNEPTVKDFQRSVSNIFNTDWLTQIRESEKQENSSSSYGMNE